MLRKLLFIIGCIEVSLVAGCASTTIGNKFDESQINKIKTGASTKENVLSLMGEPSSKSSSSNGTSIWSYQFTAIAVAARPLEFVPIVSIFAGGTTTSSSTQVLTATFNKSGIVTSCMYRTSSSQGSHDSLGGGGRANDESVEMNCEDVK